MKFITDENIRGKKVILRCDLNVPIENGIVTDDTRIIKSLNTISYLLEKECSIILMSHLGRIKVEDDKKNNSLKPVADLISTILTKEVKFVNDPVGMEVLMEAKKLQSGELMMIENTRYCDYPEKLESNNDEGLAKYWASLGEIFVVDAFASLHRNHASVSGISKFLPTYFGLLVKEEIEGLNKIVNNPQRPYAVFMGGAKVDDKLKYIKNILPKCDYLLIGGGIANSFLYAHGYDVGDSLCTSDQITLEEIRQLIGMYKEKIIMPIDFIIEDGKILDLGEKSIEKYLKFLHNSKTIFINGTCGKFEEEGFEEGTRDMFKGLYDVDAYIAAGGGDTLNAINKFKVADNFNYLSSGGGASLEYISKGELEAINYIENN